MSGSIIIHLREIIKERDAEIEWLRNAQKNRELELERAEAVFMLLEKASGTLEELQKRKMRCQWTERGEECQAPANHALPRPAIFVCPLHLTRWKDEVAKAYALRDNPEATEAPPKRVRMETMTGE